MKAENFVVQNTEVFFNFIVILIAIFSKEIIVLLTAFILLFGAIESV